MHVGSGELDPGFVTDRLLRQDPLSACVLVLRHIYGKDIEETARYLGISADAAQQIATTGLMQLRKDIYG